MELSERMKMATQEGMWCFTGEDEVNKLLEHIDSEYIGVEYDELAEEYYLMLTDRDSLDIYYESDYFKLWALTKGDLIDRRY